MGLQSPSSSSSSFSYRFAYQVFLSFRGTDTRYGFTGNLFNALDGNGIHAFIDDRELHGGDEITPSLLKAIEDSRIFIPVFSINYASSSFCLDELVHIMECSKEKGRLILPVFYGVDPSHVRHHTETESYGKALVEHEEKFQKNKEKFADNMKRLQKWKMALEQAANLSGYHFKIGNEYEHKFIGNIVKYVSNKISRVPLHVADYPVGLESRVLHVTSLLYERSDDGVHIIGIHGTGGVGKTTLAKAIYNFLADQFECLCFLHNVRENSAKHLQEMLLSKTVGLDIKLGDVSEGISIIKQRLNRKKVLLILDDVDKLQQLEVMAGGIDWFGLGSKVIITTRDKHLLASHGIERTYEVDGLNGKEALELLRWRAFKNERVDSSYENILKRAVAYASGLPLAIEIVGSDLFGKPIEDWKSALDLYEKIPNKEIQEILKVSFDALDEYGQSVFLDIACCFKGHRLAEVEDILHAHYGYCMKHQIRVLVEKSLIKICLDHVTLDDLIVFHDLIEDMGKEIVRQESPKEPGKRSRLWFHKDIIEVLEDSTGTNQIEIIHLNLPNDDEEVIEWKGDELKKMKNFRILIIKNGSFSKGPEHLPNSLRVLEWRRYPSQYMPPDFFPKKLSLCRLQESGLTSFQLCGSLKRFVNIKEINLNCCQSLTQICDVSGLQNLEILSFQSCENLLTVHESVGFLNKLKILDAQKCRKLKSFPPFELTSLQQLELSGCCRSPRTFSLSDEFLPILFTWFVNVQILSLDGNHFTILPECLKECHFLETLHLDDCKFLREIRGIPPNLKLLSAIGCKSLTSSCKSMLLSQELHKTGCIETIFSRTVRIPKWFEHQSEGSSISFWFRNKFPSAALIFATESMHYKPSGKGPFILVRLIIKGHQTLLAGSLEPAHTYLIYLKPKLPMRPKFKLEKELLKNEWIHAEVRFENWCVDGVQRPRPFCVKSGIHIYKEKSSMGDVRFTNPSLYKRRKLDDDDGGHYSHPYKNHHMPKKHRFVDNEVFETEFELLQHRITLLSLQH